MDAREFDAAVALGVRRALGEIDFWISVVNVSVEEAIERTIARIEHQPTLQPKTKED